MIPNITRGGSLRGALDYDASKGHRGEHVQPHVITGSDAVRFEIGYRRVMLTTSVRRMLAEVLDAPRKEWGREIRTRDKTNGTMKAAHVWRCSLTLAPGEKLSDDQWAAVGRRFVTRWVSASVSGY